MVGRSVGRKVGCWVGLQNILKNSKSRVGDYIDVVCTPINTLLFNVLYRHSILCIIIKIKYIKKNLRVECLHHGARRLFLQ